MRSSLKKRNGIIVLLFTVGLLLMAILMILSSKNHSWLETYEPASIEPYGTEVFKELLKATVDSQSFILRKDTNFTFPDRPSLYVFVGQYPYFDSTEVVELIEFIEKGNVALIASNYVHSGLMEQIADQSELENVEIPGDIEFPDGKIESDSIDSGVYWPWTERVLIDTAVTLYLDKQEEACQLEYVYDNKYMSRRWSHFGEIDQLNFSEDAIPIGMLNDSLINYVAFNSGNGKLLVHLTPLAFSNYSLTAEKRFNYISDCLRDLSYEVVVWDKMNMKREKMDMEDFRRTYTPSEGPLSFILSQRGLRWSWYILILGVILFVMFGARRSQRIIPIINPLKNTSVEFAESISHLYLKKKDHRPLCKLKWQLFKNHIRNQYGVIIQDPVEGIDEVAVNSITMKSGLKEIEVQELFNCHRQTKIAYQVDDNLLEKFYKQLNNFYQKSK